MYVSMWGFFFLEKQFFSIILSVLFMCLNGIFTKCFDRGKYMLIFSIWPNIEHIALALRQSSIRSKVFQIRPPILPSQSYPCQFLDMNVNT